MSLSHVPHTCSHRLHHFSSYDYRCHFYLFFVHPPSKLSMSCPILALHASGTKIIDSVAIAAVAVSAVSKRVSAIGFAALFQSSRTNVKPCASSCVV
eukprot:COSAG01_NODE_857_length_13073_cov_13.630415_7_plen_97_part_00